MARFNIGEREEENAIEIFIKSVFFNKNASVSFTCSIHFVNWKKYLTVELS